VSSLLRKLLWVLASLILVLVFVLSYSLQLRNTVVSDAFDSFQVLPSMSAPQFPPDSFEGELLLGFMSSTELLSSLNSLGLQASTSQERLFAFKQSGLSCIAISALHAPQSASHPGSSASLLVLVQKSSFRQCDALKDPFAPFVSYNSSSLASPLPVSSSPFHNPDFGVFSQVLFSSEQTLSVDDPVFHLGFDPAFFDPVSSSSTGASGLSPLYSFDSYPVHASLEYDTACVLVASGSWNCFLHTFDPTNTSQDSSSQDSSSQDSVGSVWEVFASEPPIEHTQVLNIYRESSLCMLLISANVVCNDPEGFVYDGSELLSDVVDVAVSSEFTCVLLLSSKVSCFLEDSSSVVEVLFPSGAPLSQVSEIRAGQNNVCAKLPVSVLYEQLEFYTQPSVAFDPSYASDSSFTLLCWGDVSSGVTGLDPYSLAQFFTPYPVLFPNGSLLRNVEAFDVSSSACAAVSSVDVQSESSHEVFCWGDNSFLVLGEHLQDLASSDSDLVPFVLNDGSFRLLLRPVALQFPFPMQVSDLQVAYSHACVLSTDSEVFCWGSNQEGAASLVAQDFISPSSLVGSEPFFSDVSQLWVSEQSTCVRKTTPSVVCKGASLSAPFVFPLDSSLTTSSFQRFHVVLVSDGSAVAPVLLDFEIFRPGSFFSAFAPIDLPVSDPNL